MGQEWIDPTPDNSCPTCKHYTGHVFPDGSELPLPAHPGCECFYMTTDQPGQAINWDDEPDFARQTYIYLAAYLLRNGRNLPPVLEPLRAEAEAHNQKRAEQEQNNMGKFRLNNYAAPERVDTKRHVILGASAIQAVEATGHDIIVDQLAIEQFTKVANSSPKGIKVRFTHPGLSNDGLGKLLGRMTNFRVIGDKSVGDIQLAPAAAKSPHGDLRAYMEELAANEPDTFGMSAAFSGKKVWRLDTGEELEAKETNGRPDNATTKKPLIRFQTIYAVDAVDEPAANRDGLFTAAFDNTTSTIAQDAFTSLDYYTQQYNLKPEELPTLLDNFYANNLTAIPDDIQQYIDLMLAQTEYSPSQVYSFIHRYVLARQIRPFSAEPNLQKGAIEMSQETALEETAVVEQTTATEDEISPWLAQLQTSTIEAMLNSSGLPAPTLARLRAGTYQNPLMLSQAIEASRDELASLAENNTVQLPGRPPVTSGDMLNANERAQSDIDWFFGVKDAASPAANYRRFADLYVAMTGDVNFQGIYNKDQIMFAGAITTDLAEMAANAMNKVIIQQFSLLDHWRWYERVAYATPNDGSVQDMRWTTLGGIQNLPTVAEKGAYTELDMDDVAEADSFVKQGGYVGITLEMIRKSDIMRIQAVPRALAIAALRTRSATISTIFTTASGVGPTLDQDSVALFNAAHSNLATTAFSQTAWEAARTECFKHTEVESGKALAVFPRFCLVPADLYDTALSTFGYGEGMPTSYNIHAQDRGFADPRPIPLAVPDWTDTNNWAYLVDPNVFPVIHISYAQSPGGNQHPTPELFSVTSETAGLVFTNDTLPVKVRDWFAAGVNGARGIGKRNVA